MTGAVLITVYLMVLSWFLGNDVIAKVPATLYPSLLAGMAALSGVVLVGAIAATRLEAPGAAGSGGMLAAACALGTAAAVGGLVGARRARGKR